MPETEIDELHSEIQQAQKRVSLAAALARLKENRDFQEIILKGYVESASVRLTSMLGFGPTHPSRGTVFEELTAIGHFSAYMNGIVSDGRRAAVEIAVAREELADEMASLPENEIE